MRVIIAAAGGQSKWDWYLGVPSHLAPVNGQPLLARTVAQALKLTADVHVTTPEDERYAPVCKGATRHIVPEPGISEYDSTRSLWSPNERTILLYGDVYFTDRALKTIASYSRRQYRCFGRYGPSRYTGCRYGEVFAASWWPAQHQQMDEFLARVADLRARREVTRPTAWMLLRCWQRTPLDRHQVSPRWFTEINDWTDDFDYPQDYDQHPAVRRGRV